MWPGRWLQELQPTSSIQILTQEEDIFSPRVFISKFMDRLFLVLLGCLLFGPIVEDVGMEYHTSRTEISSNKQVLKIDNLIGSMQMVKGDSSSKGRRI